MLSPFLMEQGEVEASLPCAQLAHTHTLPLAHPLRTMSTSPPPHRPTVSLQGETVPYIICVHRALATPTDAAAPAAAGSPAEEGGAAAGTPAGRAAEGGAAGGGTPGAVPKTPGPGKTGGGGLAERAHHPEEVRVHP